MQQKRICTFESSKILIRETGRVATTTMLRLMESISVAMIMIMTSNNGNDNGCWRDQITMPTGYAINIIAK